MTFHIKAVAVTVLGSLFCGQILCQNGGCAVPEKMDGPLADVDIFDELSSAFLIFKGAHIPCTGYVYQWNFVSNVAIVNGVHFSVWRPVTSAVDSYELIADVPIYGFQANQHQWNSYTHQGIHVQAGDVIGLFYDDARIRQADVVVPYADKLSIGSRIPDLFPWYETPVTFLSAAHIYYSFGNVTDLSASHREKRFPALQAIVSTVPPQTNDYGQKCFSPLSEADFQGCKGYETMRYHYNQATMACLAFEGCANGNALSNNFCTHDACDRVCVQDLNVDPETDCIVRRCAMELEIDVDFSRNCSAPRYFFSRIIGKCMEFIGCAVNGTRNNFGIMNDCRAQCEVE